MILLPGEASIFEVVTRALREGTRVASVPVPDDVLTFPSDTWAISDYSFYLLAWSAALVCTSLENCTKAYRPPCCG